MDKQQALDALNKKMARKCDCALRSGAIQAVPGHGNAEAKVLFIGEAPGKQEDIQGVPFVGASGRFLDEMLSSIRLKRADIYITNIVKYRPPANRDPLPDELAACRPWLQAQIRIIQPKIIVTLGRHAFEHFISGKKISEAHGQAFTQSLPDIGIQTIFALYHPAAALYNGSLRATLLQDFQKIPKVLRKMAREKKKVASSRF
jgi:DNA polymerase